MSLARLTWLLIGSGLAACAVILGVLAWLVTRNLRPLQSLARQIGTVSEQSLSQRFDLSQAPGELQPVVNRLNELMTRLNSAFRREKAFTGDVAHELRTPLAGIRSTLDVSLSRHRDVESYRASMERCRRISEETEAIVDTLLSLSRMESGLADRENDLVEINIVLRRTWEPFAATAAERGVTVDWSTAVPPLIETDAGKLRLILSNLFDNAASYVDPGGRILVHTRCHGARLTVCVSNTGCDLTTDQVSCAFDRFWRADVSRSETGRHAGLGLALTRRIVEFPGGTIDVRCKDRCFVAEVSLPVQDVEVPNEFEESTHFFPDERAVAGPGILN